MLDKSHWKKAKALWKETKPQRKDFQNSSIGPLPSPLSKTTWKLASVRAHQGLHLKMPHQALCTCRNDWCRGALCHSACAMDRRVLGPGPSTHAENMGASQPRCIPSWQHPHTQLNWPFQCELHPVKRAKGERAGWDGGDLTSSGYRGGGVLGRTGAPPLLSLIPSTRAHCCDYMAGNICPGLSKSD